MGGPHGKTLIAPQRLRQRADFLCAAKGKRVNARGLTLQAAARRLSRAASEAEPRFGFTVSKKCGGAVRRNRIRRRLKEALRLLNPLPGFPRYDYVIVARPEALAMAFPVLQAELLRAFSRAGGSSSSPPLLKEQEGRAAGATGAARGDSLTGRTSKR
ncbi:MAG: ribonuclease P protein component [Beijerinckiaceae bacterium]|nr:ribonuclease P protein component [Beijerinckiaceae bacterium]MCI0736990.1 ribonuclease P protein component [Beijerinckiaceae bacterium]